jgi:4'-phosphopantetheinyl transferase
LTVQIYWLARYGTGVPPDDAWLSGRERTVLACLRIPKRRADWRLGRWTAKLAIAAHRRLAPLTETLAAIEVRPASSGAPAAFVHGEPAGLALSLSHSHGIGFCALAAAGTALGCDVERVEPRSPAFLADFFTTAEQEFIERAPTADRPRVSTLLWSAKESALKALECGLRADTRSVAALPDLSAVLPAGEWRGLITRLCEGRVFHGWWRECGGSVFTLLGSPPPEEPIALETNNGGESGRSFVSALCP